MFGFTSQSQKKIFAMIILDGWGVAPVWGGNAISLASPRVFTEITKKFPYTTLNASSEAVGLPEGSPGNSEAGHLNIGAGHVVHQDQPIIDRQIEDGTFFKNQTLLGAIEHSKKNNSKIHLIGLLSKTGTHSQIKHVYSLLKMLKENNSSNVFIHLFTDGRDSDSMSGIEMLAELENQIKIYGVGRISTVVGRFYGMDRDNRWDRVTAAYNLLTLGKGTTFSSTGEIFTKSYARGVTDEFIEPSVIKNKESNAEFVSDNDAVIFFNFRADRAKEITQAFLDPMIGEKIPNRKILYNLYFASFVMHGDNTLGKHVFEPEKVLNPLAEIWSNNKLRQYHTAETEKYAHVTYFFNGSNEIPFPGEDRVMIQSPKECETYDKMPEMSALELTSTLSNTINRNIHDCFVVNYANTDMVGHSGNLKATVKAVEYVDKCLGQILSLILSKNGTAFVFADHGNAEQMVNPRTGEPDTEHTTNPVPFCIVDKELSLKSLHLKGNGALCNIAPTVLDIMKISYDKSVFSESLLEDPIK